MLTEDFITDGLQDDADVELVAGVENNEVVGLAGGCRTTIMEMSEEVDGVDLSSELSVSGSCFKFKVIALRPSAEGKGLGSKLSDELLSRAREPVVGEAWIRHSTVDGRDLLSSLGFSVELELDDYWERKSADSYTRCPECSSSPCQCPGAVMVLR